MFGIKEKRRMIRNPFISNYTNYPYQGFSNQPFHQNQNYFQHPYPSIKQQPNQMNPYMYSQNNGFVPFQMPYPIQPQKSKTNPSGGFQGIMNQFKTKDGVYDVNKMMNTAGQMMSTVNQLNGMVKQVSSLFKVKV